MKRIYLISSREPSGATWLINCFLELGIKTFRNSRKGMWQQDDRGYLLSPHEEILKKWLPSLWEHDYFQFRDDVEIQWSHEWPTTMHAQHQVIYFVRDPRDSLYSRYRRESPDQSFEDFIKFPDVQTLLNKTDNWRLFNLAWLEHPDYKVFRFEDYKQDAEKVLLEVLNFIGFVCSSTEIDRVVNLSTYGKAADAESKYRVMHPEDIELINRCGRVGEWKQGNINQRVISKIENECADVMHRLGYLQNNNALPVNYYRLIGSLPFLQQVKLPQVILNNKAGRDAAVNAIDFAQTLNREMLTKARLRQYEVKYLLDSLDNLIRNLGVSSVWTYTELRRELQLHAANRVDFIATDQVRRFIRSVGLYPMVRKIYRKILAWKNSP